MPYRLFVRADETGQISEAMLSPGPFPADPWREVARGPWWDDIARRGGRVWYLGEDGVPRAKPRVVLRAEPNEAVADGADEIVVTVDGGPFAAPVPLRVGGMPAQVSPDDPLRITWDTPTSVVIEIADPFLYGEPLTVRFV